MTTKVCTILIGCILVTFTLIRPLTVHAESDSIEMQQAQAMEFGMFFGGAASQYDECVSRGFIVQRQRKAEDEALSFIEASEQAAPANEKGNFIYVRKGWDLAKQEMKKQGPQYWKDNCPRIEQQWDKYVQISNLK